MAFQRRRNHYYHRFRYLLQALSVVSGALLVLLGIISFLSPYPVETDNPAHRVHCDYSSSIDATDDAIVEESPFGVPVFRVPNNGMRSDRDLWTSRNSKYFPWMPVTSAKILKAEAITHPNRYLALQQAEALNQQRTGITDAVVAAHSAKPVRYRVAKLEMIRTRYAWRFRGVIMVVETRKRKDLGAQERGGKLLHISNPDKERRHGKCPLTPEEVGLMLRALGYGSDVYVASGDVYGALDFIVCDESDVLLPTTMDKARVALRRIQHVPKQDESTFGSGGVQSDEESAELMPPHKI
uniref:Uncharacterized protein n=1 Tax=Cannabis sativa TaxID=3483 RepID=A0A803NNY0_CANSA